MDSQATRLRQRSTQPGGGTRYRGPSGGVGASGGGARVGGGVGVPGAGGVGGMGIQREEPKSFKDFVMTIVRWALLP
jgi:hypothetical protein